MVKKTEQQPIDARAQLALRKATDKPAAAERASLTAALVAKGLRGTDLAAFIKANRTRREMADDLKAYLRDLPKAE